MKRRTSKSVNIANTQQRGFTLIELMVAVAIIGILTQIASPAFKKFKILASRAEARTNLNNIYTLQKSFHADENRYGSVVAYGYYNDGTTETCDHIPVGPNNEIGFRTTDICNLRYQYSARSATDDYNNINSAQNFSAVATATLSYFGVNPERHGRGFGINDEGCTNPLEGTQGYLERLVLNQDRQYGFARQGDFPALSFLFDSTKQCE